MDRIPDSDKILVPHKDNEVIRSAAQDAHTGVPANEILKHLILNDIAQISKIDTIPDGKITSLFPSNTERNAEIADWLAYRKQFLTTYITLDTPVQTAIDKLDALYSDALSKYGNSASFSPFWNEKGNVNGLELVHVDDNDIFPRKENGYTALEQSQITMKLRNDIAAYKQQVATYDGHNRDKFTALTTNRQALVKKITRWHEQLKLPTDNIESELTARLGAPVTKPEATENEYNEMMRRVQAYNTRLDQPYTENNDTEYQARVLEHDKLVQDILAYNSKYDYRQDADQKWIDSVIRNPVQPTLFSEEELGKIRTIGDKFRQVRNKMDAYKRAIIPPARRWGEQNSQSSWITDTYLDQFTPHNNYAGYQFIKDHLNEWETRLDYISGNIDIPNIGAEINNEYNALNERIKAYNKTLATHKNATNNILLAGLQADQPQLDNDIDAYMNKWGLNDESMQDYAYLKLSHVEAPEENLGASPLPQPLDIGKLLQYPFDRTGAAVTNRVQEIYELTDENRNEFNYIIPRFAPFFADSIIVEKLDTEDGNPLLLKKNQDYYLGGHFGEIRPFVGQARVESLVIFDDRRITGRYRVTYQTLGGPFVLDATGYAEQIANYLVNPFQTTWGEIVGKPIEYPPVPHGHDASELMGIIDVVNAILELAAGTRALVEEERKQTGALSGYLSATEELKDLARKTSRDVSDALVNMHETSGKIKNNQIVNEVIGASLDDVDAKTSQLREELKTIIDKANKKQDDAVKESLAETLSKINTKLEELNRANDEKLAALKNNVDTDLIHWDKTNPSRVISGNVLRYGDDKNLLLPFGITFALTNAEGLPTGVVKALGSQDGLSATDKQRGKVSGIEFKDDEGYHKQLTAQDYNYYSNPDKTANYRLGYTTVNHDTMLRQMTARGISSDPAAKPLNAVDTINGLNIDTVGNAQTGTYLVLRNNEAANPYMSPEYAIGNKAGSFGYNDENKSTYKILDVGKLLPLLMKGVQELSNKQTALNNQSPVVANDIATPGTAQPNKIVKTDNENKVNDLKSIGLKDGTSTAALSTEGNRVKVPGLSTGDIVMRKPDGSSDYEVNGTIKSLADSLKLDTDTTGHDAVSADGALDKLAGLKVVNKGESGYAIDSNGLSDALGSINSVNESDNTLGGTYLNTGSALGAVLLALKDAKAKLAAVNSRVDATNNNVAAIPGASNFIPRGKVAATENDYTLPYQRDDSIYLVGRNLYWTHDNKRVDVTHYGDMISFATTVQATNFVVDFDESDPVRINTLRGLASSYRHLLDVGNIDDVTSFKDVTGEYAYNALASLAPKKTGNNNWRLVDSAVNGIFVSTGNNDTRSIMYRNLVPALVGATKHLGSKVSTLEINMTSLSSKVSGLKTTIGQHTTKLTEIAQAAENVNAQTLQDINTRIGDMKKLADGVKTQVTQITPRITALETKAGTLEAGVASAQQTATAAKNKADTLESSVNGLNTSVQQAKSKADAAAAKAAANESVGTDNTRRIAALESSATSDRAAVQTATQAARDAASKADAAKNLASGNDTRITNLGSTVGGHTTKINEMEPKITALETKVKSLQSSASNNSGNNVPAGNYVPTSKVQSSIDDKADGKIVRFFGEGAIGKIRAINFNGNALQVESNSDLTYPGRIRPRQVNLTSDRRLKSDIEKLGGINKILSLTGYSYRFNDSEARSAGLIAQEVQQVLPEAVSQDDNGYLSLDYNAVIALLVNAVKDQQEMIDILAEQVKRLSQQ